MAEPVSTAYELLTPDATDQQIVDRAAVIDLDHGEEAALFLSPSAIAAAAREFANAAAANAAEKREDAEAERDRLKDEVARLREDLLSVAKRMRDAEECGDLEDCAGCQAVEQAMKDCLRAAIAESRTDEVNPNVCPHAEPFVYCPECVVSPCPIGLGRAEPRTEADT